ncbi:site-specific DNA-methyltransferase [bacterium]|nr:site-specific DNA-methyltransferase [bacterium]
MAKINLTKEEKASLIEAVNKGVEPSPDLLPKLFPGAAEKFDVQALDRAKIPTLEYAGKRSKATILAEAGAGIGAAPLQNVRCFGDVKNGQWRNLIVQGDNLQFLKTCYKNVDPLIKDKVKGKVKLIYIDPPFATKSEFGGREGERSYADKIDAAEFIEALRERLIYLRELLADDGSIYLHLDNKMSHYAKVMMDEVFGKDNFRNEIFVSRIKKNVNEYEMAHSLNIDLDNILFYSKTEKTKIDQPKIDSDKKHRWHSFEASGVRNGMDYELFGFKPKTGNHWRWSYNRAQIAIQDRLLRPNHRTGKPEYLVTKDFEILGTNWSDLTGYSFRNNYPTEKSETLISRIILASSNPDDLVLDCFAGSGTTAAVAEKFGRRWIACDFGKHAIYTMQRRMLRIAESKALADEKDASGKVIVKKGEPYRKEPKPFCIISSGAYDFSHVMDLRKHKDTYIDFVLGLFQLSRDDDKVRKYKLANIYALKDGDPVEVYPVWDDQFLKEVKIDEEYLRGIISQSGGRLKGDYFIITPESCANVGDTVLKNQDGKDVNFQMLTFPYKVLEDISRTLELQEQPSSQDNVNNLITSTAFYFNEDVTLKARRVKEGLQITEFETRILNKEGRRFDGITGLAMLLVDLDYEPGKPFDMDVTVFAKEISEDGLVKVDNLTKKVGLIAIDKHGNESKPIELE